MSYAVDVNLLLYASDTSSVHHEPAVRFLTERRNDPDLFYLPWATLMAYLRIATHPTIFTEPLTPAEALSNIDSLLRLPRVRPLAEKEGFLGEYRKVAAAFPVRGNLVPDAHVASLLRQHGVTILYTNDADFRKFEFLDVRFPLKTRSP